MDVLQNIPNLKQAIKRSLERSAGYGLDPFLTGASESTRLSDKALRERISSQAPFYSLAKTQLDTLYGLLRDTGFCMALADSEGYVLYVVGDPDIVEHFKRRRCVPGYRWTERDLGTCAIGLVLEERIPVFLPGDMMYAAQARTISNAGAPVFSPAKDLLGVIVLSGPSNKINVHTLGLVRQAAETVTAQLREGESTRELAVKNQYMEALLESDSRGIVTLDQNGRIVHANLKARTLFNLAPSYQGTNFADNLDERQVDICGYLAAGKSFNAREIRARCSGVSHFASVAPIRMPSGELVGGLLSVLEKKEMMSMAVQVTGARAHFTFDDILGKSELMETALHLARIAAGSNASVLITGETGTGKELFAQAIHNGSERRHRPFVAINCGAIPKELLESELFGYEDGAFTGARKGGRPGKLELADTGTLFLDEIGDMPFDMQVKLLRVLQTGELQRVGGLRVTPVDLRVISATNKDLQQAITAHQFRADLYYRISTLGIQVPALRRRPEDILLLARYFLKRQEQMLNRPPHVFPHRFAEALRRYAWPGNVRQLESAMECAVHLAQGGELLPEHCNIAGLQTPSEPPPVQDGSGRRIRDMEKKLIAETLAGLNGNILQTARSLGISRPSLYRKLRAYGISGQPEG